MNLWLLLLAAFTCAPAPNAGRETTFTCVHAYDREVTERYTDKGRCDEAADGWRKGSRPDLLLMHTADCVPLSVDAKKK